jgi:predicted ATP-grasp superfamily ATP-dependent carboligase
MINRRVLLPNAVNRPALTVIRSLGNKGCEVYAGSPGRSSLAGLSRFAAGTVLHPDPGQDPSGFIDAIIDAVAEYDIGAVVPVADVAANVLIEYEHRFGPEVRLVLPPRDALARAHDKVDLMRLARQLEVPVPDGFEADGNPLDHPGMADLQYPVILKPRASRHKIGGRWKSTSVMQVRDADHLRRSYEDYPEFHDHKFLVQKKVPGEGRGVFLVARDGEIACVFGHRRIREKPPWGGVSTLCETASPDPRLVEYSARLIKALRWSGVAMVEFKFDPTTGEAWLMEINGRFWGSMQLAVASGVDFPWLVYQQEVLGRPIDPNPIKRDVRLWWMCGDLDHFLLRLSQGGLGALPAGLGDLLRTRQGHILDFDTFQANDPIPFLYEIGQWAKLTWKGLLAW